VVDLVSEDVEVVLRAIRKHGEKRMALLLGRKAEWEASLKEIEEDGIKVLDKAHRTPDRIGDEASDRLTLILGLFRFCELEGLVSDPRVFHPKYPS
jgi:hypothetical protein